MQALLDEARADAQGPPRQTAGRSLRQARESCGVEESPGSTRERCRL